MYQFIKSEKKFNGVNKEGRCLSFDKNLREVNVSFKIRGDVFVILIELRRGECNFP